MGSGAVLALITGLSGVATAQQSTLDPYKPYTRGYQAFADPGATIRPGFPNPLGGSGRPTYGNIFDPNGQGIGGIDPFSAPYYNRFQSPSLNRGLGTYQRSRQDLTGRPERLVDPQERLDREFYDQLQKRDDPYLKLQEKRDDLYFRALQETDPQKRAELMKAFQKASQQSAAAFSSPRRTIRTPVSTGRRDLGTRTGAAPASRAGAGARPNVAPTPAEGGDLPAPSSLLPGDSSRRPRSRTQPQPGADRPDSLRDAIERSDALDRANGLPSPRANAPASTSRTPRQP